MRAGNFEAIMVTLSQEESIALFDWMWEHDMFLTNQVERIYSELNYVAPEGSQRKARYDAVKAEISARKRAKVGAAEAGVS